MGLKDSRYQRTSGLKIMDLRERQRAFSAQRINGPAQLPPPLVGDGDPTHLDLPRKIQFPFATVSLAAAAVYPDPDTSPPDSHRSRPTSQDPGASPRLAALLRQPVPQTLYYSILGSVGCRRALGA